MERLNRLYLFARPSFLAGFTRFLDTNRSLSKYNISRTGHEADSDATLSDWQAVGDDLRYAISRVKDELKQAQQSKGKQSGQPRSIK